MAIGHSFIELESVDSTNNYAMALAMSGRAPHGTLFFANDQWAGKGQRGRSWTSTPGENIVLSAVLEPVALQPTLAWRLSVAVSLACYDLFSHYAGADLTTIKWPNDIYWSDRKAGGILIENHFQGDRWPLAIAGMGMNINQVVFPETAKNPVSLRQITGRSFRAVDLARELGDFLDKRYAELMGQPPNSGGGISEAGIASPDNRFAGKVSLSPGTSQNGSISQLQEYNTRLYRRGQSVRLKKDNAVFETTVQGVSAQGRLLTRDVLDREFAFGEVEWIIPAPSMP